MGRGRYTLVCLEPGRLQDGLRVLRNRAHGFAPTPPNRRDHRPVTGRTASTRLADSQHRLHGDGRGARQFRERASGAARPERRGRPGDRPRASDDLHGRARRGNPAPRPAGLQAAQSFDQLERRQRPAAERADADQPAQRPRGAPEGPDGVPPSSQLRARRQLLSAAGNQRHRGRCACRRRVLQAPGSGARQPHPLQSRLDAAHARARGGRGRAFHRLASRRRLARAGACDQRPQRHGCLRTAWQSLRTRGAQALRTVRA